jgi:hypothetical protein
MERIIRADHVVEFAVRDIARVSRTLGTLEQFVCTRRHPEAMEFVWTVPRHSEGKRSPQPVAVVRLGRGTMRVECLERRAFHAIQILISCLIGEDLMSACA